MLPGILSTIAAVDTALKIDSNTKLFLMDRKSSLTTLSTTPRTAQDPPL